MKMNAIVLFVVPAQSKPTGLHVRTRFPTRHENGHFLTSFVWFQVYLVPSSNCVSLATARSKFRLFCSSLHLRNQNLKITDRRLIQEIHPIHVFLAVPDRPARPNLLPLSPTLSSSSNTTPEDVRLAVLRARGIVGSSERWGDLGGENPPPSSSIVSSASRGPPRRE